MATFYGRICISYSYAQENEGRALKLVPEMIDCMEPAFHASLEFLRWSYGVLKMEALNEDACVSAMEKAWKKAHPDAPDVASYLAVRDDGGDAGDLMHSILTALYGAESYVEMCTDIYKSIPFLKKNGALKALRKQHYLFAIDQGCGFTTLISSLGDFLRRMGTFEDETEKRTHFREYVLGKDTEKGCTSEDDVISSLRDQTEDNNKNLIGLDIGYYLDGQKFDDLRRFLVRLHSLEDEFIFAFRTPFLEKKALKDILAVLEDQLVVRVVEIPPLHDEVLREYLADGIGRLGYKPDASLLELYFRKINEEKADGRFYGFRTADKLAREIVLRKAAADAAVSGSGRTPETGPIRASELEGFVRPVETGKSGYDELSELIGMETIRERIREIAAQVKMSMRDPKLDRPCIHMRFVGAPGTGKTTVARIVGRIFKEEGILRKGAFLEYSARNLCAEYVGQTAVKTASICRDAYGSVLFIDEAYALYQNTNENSNDYGKEALTTLISEMENHRDDMLVIMAGYTDDMETLMSGNAGLRSRMPYLITFANYTRDQLHQIFMSMVSKHFSYTPELEQASKEYFRDLSEEFVKSREFSNARFVRNLYERTWSKGALRCSMAGLPTISLTNEDFLAASGEKEFKEKLRQTIKVGF